MKKKAYKFDLFVELYLRQLQLNDLLHFTPEEIDNCKIELNMTAGKGGESYLNLWLEHDEKEKTSRTCVNCSY